MSETNTSRRGFLTSVSAAFSGVLLMNPGSLWAKKSEVKDILSQMELKALAKSRPMRDYSVQGRTTGEMTVLYREGRRGSRPLGKINPMGRRVWEACDGRRTPKEISRMLHQDFFVSRRRAWLDTFTFLAGLKRIGAIQ